VDTQEAAIIQSEDSRLKGIEAEDALRRVQGLGSPVVEFRAGILMATLVLALPFIVAGSAILFAVSFIGGVHALEFLAAAAFLVLAGIMLVVRGIRNRFLRVLVFPEGLVRINRQEAQAVLWEEIDRIWWNGLPESLHAWGGWAIRGTRVMLKTSRHELEFDNSLPRLKELFQRICKATLPYQLPRALEAYLRGKTLDFGRLQLSQAGMSQDARSLAWGEIERLLIHDTEYRVYKKGKGSHYLFGTASDTANLHLLRPLINVIYPALLEKG
jgi:hypothetical protein